MSGTLWSLATILGPIILAAAIIYALVARRKLTPRERVRQAETTQQRYREAERTDP
ncbi:MAG: hypothetical protein KF723_07330 [Rhizobiaceae bacterium]|nr:hypothetical protein [Rhizobiaceae bacterium]